MPLSSDYLIKLKRARGHLEDLKRHMLTWFHGDHYDILTERDLDGGPDGWRVRIVTDRIPLDPFAVLIGDVLHNLRGTLDHLAYALAEANPLTPKPLQQDIAENCEFPIYGDERLEGVAAVEKRYGHDFARKTKGIAPAAQAVIKSLQPYQRGNDYASHPLWMLYDLSNIDKHRLLVVGALSSRAPIMLVGKCRNYQFTGDFDSIYQALVEDEAVIARFHATTKDPALGEMHMEFDALLEIVFNCGIKSVDSKGVIDTLGIILTYIESDAIRPLAALP